MKNSWIVSVKRQDGPQKTPYWQEFAVPRVHGSTVLDLLTLLNRKPLTVNGELVSPVIWESGMIRMNYEPVDPVKTLVPQDVSTLVLEPFQSFPVIRDLWVDRSKAFAQLADIPFAIPIQPLPRADQIFMRDTRRESEKIWEQCTSCTACLEVCPRYGEDQDYLGAMAFVKSEEARRRGVQKNEFLIQRLSQEDALSGCGHAAACAAVCPEKIPTTEAIARLNRERSLGFFKKIFGT